MERAALAVYSALMWLARPLLRMKVARRAMVEPGYGEAIDQRFGDYGAEPPEPGFIWLHAVSLGETRASVALIARLREHLPGMRLLLTSGTATGRAEAAKLLAPGDQRVWQPWDTPDAARRFLEHFKPSIGILMETEIWPNLCTACERAGIPLVLANARMSEKSFRRTEPFAWLARPAYRSLAAVWAQTEADADRLRRLGAPVAGVLGNLKFDAEPSATQLAAGREVRAASDRPIVMFASSREGEELLLLQYLKEKRPSPLVHNEFPAINSVVISVQWLIVPRHPQRFDSVAQLIARQGFSVARRSAWAATQGQGGPEGQEGRERHGARSAPDDVWLGDSLGEMAYYYGMSDVALLGGSFEPLGGQNLIEAAACGCPVVMGPHTFNFAGAAELAREAGAAIRVDSMDAAVRTAVALASDRTVRAAAAEAASRFAGSHRDAARKTAAAIGEILAHRQATGRASGTGGTGAAG